MTIDEIREMSDEELYELSLQKAKCKKNGKKSTTYTYDADLAYAERYKRSGVIRYIGISNSCNKYQADIDYYGCYEPDHYDSY